MMSEIAVSEAAVSEVAVGEATVGETAVRDAAMSEIAANEIAANEIATNAVAAVKSLDSTVPTRSPPTQQLPFRVIAVGSLIALVVLWAGWRLFHSHPDHLPPASSDSQTSLQQAASSAGTSQSPAAATAPSPRASASSPTSASASASTAAVHQVIPDVPRHARESIRGRIKVTVRVTVDRSGNVIGERLVSSSSSRYFARLASDAAAKWKFAPADKQGSREWLLRFEFTRGGAIGQVATPPT
jgi:TonB family protein